MKVTLGIPVSGPEHVKQLVIDSVSNIGTLGDDGLVFRNTDKALYINTGEFLYVVIEEEA